jgi:hypothetical protein
LGNKRLSQAMIGMGKAEFESELPGFEKIWLEKMKAKKRKRAVGAGQKEILKSTKEKLFFIFFYMKTNPTFDVAGVIFQTVRSACYAWFKKNLPMLEKTLGRQMFLPKRKLKTKEEFMRLFECEDVFIDGTIQEKRKNTQERTQ